MKLTTQFKLFASVTAILTAGLIGCHIHRGGHISRRAAPEAPRRVEPLPLAPAPYESNQPLLIPPQSQVPPADDELPVPSAGLGTIQRMSFSSCSSCSTCSTGCSTPCGSCNDICYDCSPSWRARFINRTNEKLTALHCRTRQFLSSLKSGGCSSCSVCDTGCFSSCDPCCSSGMAMDGFVVSDCTMPSPCCSPCMTSPCGMSPCGMSTGVWSPVSQPMMPQGYYPQQYPQMPMQAPCNCQQGQAGMSYPGYGAMPQGYAAMPQQGYAPQMQPGYPAMAPQGYGMQPGAQPPMPQQYQYQYPPQQRAPQVAPIPAPVPQTTGLLEPGHSQPNYTQPAAVAPRSGLQ